jgi:hypothetical protein
MTARTPWRCQRVALTSCLSRSGRRGGLRATAGADMPDRPSRPSRAPGSKPQPGYPDHAIPRAARPAAGADEATAAEPPSARMRGSASSRLRRRWATVPPRSSRKARALRPPVVAVIDRCVRSILRGAIAPTASGLKNMQDATDHPTVVYSRLARLATRKMWFDRCPGVFRQPEQMRHSGLLAS